MRRCAFHGGKKRKTLFQEASIAIITLYRIYCIPTWGGSQTIVFPRVLSINDQRPAWFWDPPVLETSIMNKWSRKILYLHIPSLSIIHPRNPPSSCLHHGPRSTQLPEPQDAEMPAVHNSEVAALSGGKFNQKIWFYLNIGYPTGTIAWSSFRIGHGWDTIQSHLWSYGYLWVLIHSTEKMSYLKLWSNPKIDLASGFEIFRRACCNFSRFLQWADYGSTPRPKCLLRTASYSLRSTDTHSNGVACWKLAHPSDCPCWKQT